MAAGLLVLVVGLGLIGLRSLGAFEFLELSAYDGYLRLRSIDRGPSSRIVVVACTERDLQSQRGWPLSDAVIAGALRKLLGYGPRAVGLDIYRDVPVPPGSEELDRVLKEDSPIVAVMHFGGGGSAGVAPPPVLKDSELVGFNDILVDPGGTVRRGLLYVDDGGRPRKSFALQLALFYLGREGITERADTVHPGQLRLGRRTIPPMESHDGPYVGADARGYQFLLDFRDGGTGFTSFSLTDLLEGRVGPASVKDKVVLVGVTAESVQDRFYTPHSRGLRAGRQQVVGLMIHAHAVSQLLRMALDAVPPLRVLGTTTEAVWILLWAAVGGAIGLGVRAPWHFAVSAAGAILALGLADFVAFAQHLWLPLVPPAVAVSTSAALVTAYVSHQETAKRSVLMGLFSRHVSREVAETIWQDRDQFLDGRRPRSQRLVATVLFSDLSGFTALAERLPPEVLMDWLNEYMEAMAQEASRWAGVIRQYAGDTIVMVFGVPVARQSETEISQDAVNAVNCALAMEQTLIELNRRWETEGRPTTAMRIGIFTGPVVAGILGSAERSDYAVVGDTVNIAERLESFDKDLFQPDPVKSPCRILIGETTLGRLSGRFHSQRVGDVYLKGKEQSVAVYRIVGQAREAPTAE